MKIIVTEEQKKIINEALGVPKHILDVAEKMYQIVLRDLKSITEKQDEYEFDGVTYFDLGDKKQIPIRSYTLTVEVHETDQIDDGVQIASMGMGQQFTFDRGIMMRLNRESNEADFHIKFYGAENWEPKDLVKRPILAPRGRSVLGLGGAPPSVSGMEPTLSSHDVNVNILTGEERGIAMRRSPSTPCWTALCETRSV